MIAVVAKFGVGVLASIRMGENRQPAPMQRQKTHHRRELFMRIFDLDAEIWMRAHWPVMPVSKDNVVIRAKMRLHRGDQRRRRRVAASIEIDMAVPACRRQSGHWSAIGHPAFSHRRPLRVGGPTDQPRLS